MPVTQALPAAWAPLMAWCLAAIVCRNESEDRLRSWDSVVSSHPLADSSAAVRARVSRSGSRAIRRG